MSEPLEISLRERIRLNLIAAMEKSEVSQVQLAEKLGISKGTVNNWARGNNSPDVDMVPKICKVLGVSILSLYSPSSIEGNENLAHIQKSAPLYSSEALKLAKDYDGLDVHGKRILRVVADEEVARISEEKKKIALKESSDEVSPRKLIPIRFSTQAASAGTGVYLGPESFETIWVEDNALTRRASFAVPVSGDSMEPKYFNEDILLVERVEAIEVGEIGIFTLDGDGYVKKLGKGVLVSLNKAYSPIPLNESIRCNGRIIGVLDPDWMSDASQ